MEVTPIYFDSILTFSALSINESLNPLATIEQFYDEPRDIGTIFDALSPGEYIELSDGVFTLDDDLDLIDCN